MPLFVKIDKSFHIQKKIINLELELAWN